MAARAESADAGGGPAWVSGPWTSRGRNRGGTICRTAGAHWSPSFGPGIDSHASGTVPKRFSRQRQAVISQDDVASCDADVFPISGCSRGRDVERKRQRVFFVPCDAGDAFTRDRVEQGRRVRFFGLHRPQPDNMPPGRIRIGRIPGFSTHDFFKEEQGSRHQVRVMPREGRLRRPCRQAASSIAPGVELQPVVILVERLERFHGFEDRVRLGVESRIVDDRSRLTGKPGCQPGPCWNRRMIGIHSRHIG